MKVAIFNGVSPRFNPGGAERVAESIARELVKKQINVVLIHTDNRILYPMSFHTSKHYKIIYLPWRRGWSLLCLSVGRFIKEMLKEFDILHVHNYSFSSLCNDKTIFTYHAPNDDYLFKRVLIKDAVMNSAIVTTPSRKIAWDLSRRFGKKVVTIPNGVDTSTFRPLGIAPEERMVLFVGRLTPYKGVETVIRLAEVLPDVKFTIIGSGPLSGYVGLKAIKLPNLKFIGFVDGPLKVYYYNKAMIALFPSLVENFPLTGLEAMACGTPVVASRIGFSEYIKDGYNGVLVDPKNIEEISDKITELLTNKEFRDFIRRNALLTAQEFNWSVITQKYINLYLEII
jgi:glycosyltransferase involved in cell wall biosynthesis